jgi:signal transduction histidine kinase
MRILRYENGAILGFNTALTWSPGRRFLALCFLCAALLLFVRYRRRFHQIQKSRASFDERLAERMQVAREFHDTFLQTLQGSKLVADDALEKSSDPVQMRRAMEHLSDWLGQAVEEGRAAQISLRVSTVQRDDLADAFKRATKERRSASPMEVSCYVTGHPKEMHPIIRDELYRVGFEAIRNAYSHSRGSRLEVGLKYGQDLTLLIKDNGVGIDTAFLDHGKEGHVGLHGMRERVARIGGKLTVVTAIGSGTEVRVVVPGRIVFREPSALDKIRTILRI